MGKQKIADNLTLSAQFGNGAPEIDGVPEDDGRYGEIEAGSPVPLVLKSPVTDFTKAMKEHRSGERVTGLALVEPGIRPPAQSRVADPIEREERAFEASNLAERFR